MCDVRWFNQKFAFVVIRMEGLSKKNGRNFAIRLPSSEFQWNYAFNYFETSLDPPPEHQWKRHVFFSSVRNGEHWQRNDGHLIDTDAIACTHPTKNEFGSTSTLIALFYWSLDVPHGKPFTCNTKHIIHILSFYRANQSCSLDFLVSATVDTDASVVEESKTAQIKQNRRCYEKKMRERVSFSIPFQRRALASQWRRCFQSWI